MKFSRQGKLIFSTAVSVCAAQILNLDKILETPISTAVTFENISKRFLVFDIPTTLPLSELAAEIMHKTEMEVVELRRFVKLNSTQEFSPSQYSTKRTSKNPPNRKRQMINLVPPTNNPMQWDAGGSNASD
ncbi:putative RNA-directed DNA polymerase from transposon X-element [Caerostris extrusa]|uniref:RNA-directed DNA polymerase from transposon X-element n=1 Tax=Caerostris extrusa TaxID=172846 RepID=A0AAV4TXI6_CAEEX|nr:putative RNA-directed DNA polymerase from transposon X-element [Caerostris extrusa]